MMNPRQSRLERTNECDDGLATSLLDQLRNLNSRASGGSQNHRVLTALAVVEIIFAAILIAIVAGALWLVRGALGELVDWLLWIPLLIAVGAVLAGGSAYRWRQLSEGAFLDRKTQTTAIVVGITAGCILVTWVILHIYVNPEIPSEKTDVAQIAVAIVGGTVIAIGSWVGWQTLQVNRERLELDRTANLTENFTAAVEQLGATLDGGNPNYEIRLGGIYALERIAKSWLDRGEANDYWSVIEVLTAYVRHNAPCSEEAELEDGVPQPRLDIEAILGVLRHRHGVPVETDNNFRIDLNGTNLRGAFLAHIDLDRADLRNADLSDATLTSASLKGVMLSDAKLQRAFLNGARLNGSLLERAILENANLTEADLERARLHDAQLNDAKLVQANLHRAVLSGAQLRRADLSGAQCVGAWFFRCDLSSAVLESTNLTDAQLVRANLEGARMEYTTLTHAMLSSVRFNDILIMHKSQLTAGGIMPSDTNLTVVPGSEASLKDALLFSDLSGAYGLTVDALLEAKLDDLDILPPHLKAGYLDRVEQRCC